MNNTTVNQPIPPYETEASLWEGAYCFLLELRELRGLGLRRPDHEEAERAISRFCHSLRQSPRWLSLPRIQHEQHLSDPSVVIVITALACHAHMPKIIPTIQQVGVLAFGFDPLSNERFRQDVQNEKSVGKLIRIEHRQHYRIIHPSEHLLMLIGNSKIPIDAVENIQKLPSAPISRDINFKRGRK